MIGLKLFSGFFAIDYKYCLGKEMTTLQALLKSPGFYNRLVEVNELLDSPTTRITILGTQVVEVKGDAVSLEEMTDRLFIAAEKRSKAAHLSLKERRAGITIVEKLRPFHHVTKDLIRDSNLLTKVIIFVRGLLAFITMGFLPQGLPTQNFPYLIDEELDRLDRSFRSYKDDQFIAQFGPFPPEGRGVHPAVDNPISAGRHFAAGAVLLAARRECIMELV